MTDMKALQVTGHGRPGRCWPCAPSTGPSRGRGRSGCGWARLAQLQRHRPVPGQAGLGARRRRRSRWAWMSAGWSTRSGEGAEAWLGRRVVAITKTALGGIAEYAIAPAVSVFDAPDRLRRRRGDRLPADLPDLAPGPVPPGPAARPARRWWCTRRPAGWARPASSWARRPGPGSSPWPAGRRRARCAPSLGRRPGHRPHGRGLRRGGAGRHRRRRRRRGLRPGRRGLRRAVVAVHGPRAAGTWPSASPTTTTTA